MDSQNKKDSGSSANTDTSHLSRSSGKKSRGKLVVTLVIVVIVVVAAAVGGLLWYNKTQNDQKKEADNSKTDSPVHDRLEGIAQSVTDSKQQEADALKKQAQSQADYLKQMLNGSTASAKSMEETYSEKAAAQLTK